MEKKGTGWIPDYPDIRDYNLTKHAIQNLSSKVQISDETTTSIDKLLNTVHSALNIQLRTNPELKKIITDLDEYILSNIRFLTVKYIPEIQDNGVSVNTSDNMEKLKLLAYELNIPYNLNQKKEHILPPIAQPVFKLILIKILGLQPPLLTSEDKAIEEFIRSLNEEKSNEEESKLQSRKLIKSIIEVITQMLMPLNQHSNLNEALERELENIKQLLENKNDNQQETKNLIGKTIEAYNFMLGIKLNNVKNCDIKKLIFDAIEEIEQDIKDLLEANNQIENTLIHCIIQAYKQRQPSGQKKLAQKKNSVL
ncbi:MAG: hypothetical protein PUP93_18545 [Rhizonema sp. NSF051]|nr:hypothetical protein [Rhizonema sp. NSF051]